MENMKGRIPDLRGTSMFGMTTWFDDLNNKGIMFHPDDDPSTVTDSNGFRLFTAPESDKIRGIVTQLFELFGDDVYVTAERFINNEYIGEDRNESLFFSSEPGF